MTVETLIESLTNDEKLVALDLIWRDLTANADAFRSPSWHSQVLSDRLANPAAGASLSIDDSIAEVRKELRGRSTSS